MKIILDERETALYEKCILLNDKNEKKIEISKRVLNLGDIIITTDDDKDIILVERKSIQDLLSSIKDGRYEEQSYRLIHSSGYAPHNIIYLIEGITSQLEASKKKMVYSAITSLNIFKGFSVFRTSSVQETAEWILATTDKMSRELAKGKMIWSSSNSTAALDVEPASYCSVVKKVKKDNITPENWGEIVLCQIPGISSVSAVAIMKRFQSISHLIAEIREHPECLDAIVCESDKKSRKLGKNIIENLRTFLLYAGDHLENKTVVSSEPNI